MILVTGNPRSGTLSIKNMLRMAGYDVQHERNGTDGTVSCFFFTQATYYPREKLTARRHMNSFGKDESFEKLLPYYSMIIHLVRNPLFCIPSMAKIVGTGHQEWLEAHGVVKQYRPKSVWSAEAWYSTNMRIEEELAGREGYRIMRIERAQKDWPKELDEPLEVLHQHAGSGTRKSEPLTKRKLKALSPLAPKILAQARRYGYNI